MKRLLFFLAVAATNVLLAQITPAIIKDIQPGNGDGCSTDYHLSELNGKAYFFAREDGFDPALFVSNGTSSGTFFFRGFGHSTNSDEESFFKFNNMLFWVGYDSAHYADDVQIFRTDGTNTGTLALKSFFTNSSSAFYNGPHFINNSNTLFFIASDSSDWHLWRTDGSVSGTYKLFTYPSSAARELYGVVNDKLVFSSQTKIYASDGTVAGTHEIYSPSTFMLPSAGVSMGGNLYFSYDGALWKTNGTAAGTTAVTGSFSGNATVVGSKMFYSNDDGVNGSELWVTDGTVNGTKMVDDINPGYSSSSPAIIGTTANQVIFIADNGTIGFELWASDGTNAGTITLKDICAGGNYSFIGASATDEINHIVYFSSDNCEQSQQLYRTDGTPSGTYQVSSLATGAIGFTKPFVIDGMVYYSCVSNAIGQEMFVTNGQPGGTVFYDLNPGSGWSYSSLFTKVADKIFFNAIGSGTGRELWSVDPPVISGIGEMENENNLLDFYPNPVEHYLKVSLSGQEMENVQIYNMNGQLVLEARDMDEVYVGSLSSGIYIAEVITGNAMIRKRFVKL